MERQTRQVQKQADRDTSVFTQRGFTYLELTISLFILLVILPAIFFCLISLITEGQKLMGEQRLQMDWSTCYTWMQKEIKQGDRFRTEKEALLFEISTGETIRYRWKDGNIVRDVKKPTEPHFKGFTLLLPQVISFRFVPYRKGVIVAFTLRDTHKAQFFVRTFIRGRVDP